MRHQRPSYMSVRDWLLLRSHIDDAGCWIWQGHCNVRWGYAVLWDPERQKVCRANRLAWEAFRGPIPDGLSVLHECDVRACVNPDHLFLGSYADNHADMVAKGRDNTSGRRRGAPHGEQNHRAKLTEADVRAIRADPRQHRWIAEEYGISRPAVSQIKLRKRWAHVI